MYLNYWPFHTLRKLKNIWHLTRGKYFWQILMSYEGARDTLLRLTSPFWKKHGNCTKWGTDSQYGYWHANDRIQLIWLIISWICSCKMCWNQNTRTCLCNPTKWVKSNLAWFFTQIPCNGNVNSWRCCAVHL